MDQNLQRDDQSSVIFFHCDPIVSALGLLPPPMLKLLAEKFPLVPLFPIKSTRMLNERHFLYIFNSS